MEPKKTHPNPTWQNNKKIHNFFCWFFFFSTSLNIFIYNNHNILVCIVKKHCPKPYAMVVTKQHLQFKILTEIIETKP